MSLINKNNTPLKYPLYLGSLTLVGGLAYLLYKKHLKGGVDSSSVPRELVKKVLKDFKKHMYPLFYEIRIMSKNIQNQVRMQTKRVQIPPEYLNEIRQMIVNGPNFKVKVEQIEDTVYSKHNIIDRKVFEKIAEELSTKDPEIKALMQQIRNIYAKSLDGESCDFDGVIPDNIGHDLLLDLRKQQIKNELDAFLTFCIQYEQMHGKINPQDPKFSLEMEEALKESDKLFILPEAFNCCEEYLPLTIYQEAIKKYSHSNPEFNKNLVQLENFKSQIMRKSIYQGNLTGLTQELIQIDKIGVKEEPLIKEIAQPIEEEQKPLTPQVEDADQLVENEIEKIEEKLIQEEDQKQDNQEVVGLQQVVKVEEKPLQDEQVVTENKEEEHVDLQINKEENQEEEQKEVQTNDNAQKIDHQNNQEINNDVQEQNSEDKNDIQSQENLNEEEKQEENLSQNQEDNNQQQTQKDTEKKEEQIN